MNENQNFILCHPAFAVRCNISSYYMLHSISINLQYSVFSVHCIFLVVYDCAFQTQNQSIEMFLHFQHSSPHWKSELNEMAGACLYSKSVIYNNIIWDIQISDDGRQQATTIQNIEYEWNTGTSGGTSKVGEMERAKKKTLNIHLRALVCWSKTSW